MKRSFIILSLFFVCFNSFTQTYHKLIRLNTYWDVWLTEPPDFCYTYANRIYFTNNDTLINGNYYTLSLGYPIVQVNPGPFCPPFVVLNNPYPTNQFLREDTTEKKVYIFCQECIPQQDDLFYDFTIQVGDTLHSYHAGSGYTLVCRKIDSVTLQNNEIRKRFKFTPTFSNDTTYYTESIGGGKGLFQELYPYLWLGGYFCQNENGTNLWGDYCNYYFVGTNDISDVKSFSIFPNPVHDFVNVKIDVSENNWNFILSNIQGQIVIDLSLKEKLNQINISQLAPGVYNYNLKSSRTNSFGKICIF